MGSCRASSGVRSSKSERVNAAGVLCLTRADECGSTVTRCGFDSRRSPVVLSPPTWTRHMNAMNIFGQHEAKTLAQLADVGRRATRVALMADGHLGYVMPIGGVAAYDQQVSVVGVGFDIACGNAAIRTNLTLDRFTRDELANLADETQATISFGVGRSNHDDDA